MSTFITPFRNATSPPDFNIGGSVIVVGGTKALPHCGKALFGRRELAFLADVFMRLPPDRRLYHIHRLDSIPERYIM
jgi:hypothetical protein